MTVRRPSGKMTQWRPSLTALIMVLVASGLVGSTGSRLTEQQKRFDPPFFCDVGIDGEGRFARQECTEQQGIYHRNMIGDDDRAGARRAIVFQPPDVDARTVS